MSKIEPKLTEGEIVPVWYYEAFGLKIKGVSYPNIAKTLGKSLSSVKQIFYSKGKMYRFYREYAEAQKAENVEDALDMMMAHIPDVLRMEIVAAQDHGENPMVAMLSRHKIMDYALGKPEDRLKINASIAVMTFADWVKQTTINKKDDDRTRSNGEVPKGSG